MSGFDGGKNVEVRTKFQIEVDKLLRLLPLHLTAVLLSSKRDEASLRYLLSGFRLLYSLCEIASRHPKLEQVSYLNTIFLLFEVEFGVLI